MSAEDVAALTASASQAQARAAAAEADLEPLKTQRNEVLTLFTHVQRELLALKAKASQ